MKMYADYIKERMGDEIVIRHEGFATYRYIDHCGDKAVYIVDIYTRPDFRKTKIASELADEIVRRGLEAGCKVLLGTVSTLAKNPTDSIKVLLAYGFEFYSGNEDGLIFKKEI